MFKKFFKAVAAKLSKASEGKPTEKIQSATYEIPEVKNEDKPNSYPKVKTRNLGKNIAKRHLAIRALGKTRKQLRETGLRIRPKVARIRASRMVA